MYKPYSDSHLMSLTRVEIIELLRTAEHNFFAMEEALNNSAKAGMEIAEKYDEAKRLLKSAIDEWNLVCEWGNCGEYCGWFKNGKCTQEWSGKAEALKLIGDEPNK